MDSQTTETESQVARRPRIRIGHDRSRFVHALQAVARALDAPIDPPTLAIFAELPEDEYRAICDRVGTAFSAGIEGIGKSKILPDEVQLKEFVGWQHQRPPYFHWDQVAMDALGRKLKQLGPGCELIPCFAMSVQVKLPSGKLILINRRGEETKS